MDQNANGTDGEAHTIANLGDAYTAPMPQDPNGFNTSPLFPSNPYTQDTVPILIPGPYITNTYTNTGGTVALNTSVTDLYVQFDRFVDISTFIDKPGNTTDQILRIMGPTGDITASLLPYVTVTAQDADGSGSASLFKIHLDLSNPSVPADVARLLSYSGTYTVQIGSGIKTRPVGTAPAYGMDTNYNAGLDVLRGTASTTSTTTTVTTTAVGASGVGPVPDVNTDPVTHQITGPGTQTFNLNVGSQFNLPTTAINGKSPLTVTFSIETQSDSDLTGILVAPNGSWVVLFNQVLSTSGNANFINTTLDDRATTSIQNGGAPFSNGTYKPGGATPSASVLTSLGLDPLKQVGSLTALAVSQGTSSGQWSFKVVDNVQNDINATVTAWAVNLQKFVPKSGMNEPVADQYSGSFRVFTMAPSNPLSSETWSAVGGAALGDHSGRVTGLAVDPSDPTGNTVYVGGASGGIWKSTNFLSPNGPTYIPVTNFGPNNAINIGGIDVFARNNDPTQSIVFAATGEGDTGSPGAGILRSMDGGATWQVLDSSSNVDASGNLLPIDSPQRDHVMVGFASYKIVADPHPTPSGGVVVYAATSKGLWRSVDTGNHWTLLKAGPCTDVVLDPNSGKGGPNGNLQNVWAAFQGLGVFFSNAQGQFLNLVSGGIGDPLIQAAEDHSGAHPLTVSNSGTNPNGALGRIVLAKPALTGNASEDAGYQGWLYVAVVKPDGSFSGLYATKDYGQNWTKLRIPALVTSSNGSNSALPSNDLNRPDYSVTGGTPGAGLSPQGNYDFSMAIDPQNPNIVYIGGMASGQPTGLIRVDATLASDAHSLVPFSVTGGALLKNSKGPVSVADLTKAPTNYNGKYYYNLIPTTTIKVTNASNGAGDPTSTFTNDGAGVTWIPFDIAYTDQHRMITMVDPVTGYTRIIIGDDQGVFTTVDKNGTQISSLASYPAASTNRNGNIQITQFYYGASTPTGSTFYGSAQDDGFAGGSNVLNVGSVPDATSPTSPGTSSFPLFYGDDFPIPTTNLTNGASLLTTQIGINTQSATDLTAVLVGPNGKWIKLFGGLPNPTVSQPGVNPNANFNYTQFDDNAGSTLASAITSGAQGPFTGTFKPDGGTLSSGVLSALGLLGANQETSLTALASSLGFAYGQWSLKLVDSNPNGVKASLTDWSISVQNASGTVSTASGAQVPDATGTTPGTLSSNLSYNTNFTIPSSAQVNNGPLMTVEMLANNTSPLDMTGILVAPTATGFGCSIRTSAS